MEGDYSRTTSGKLLSFDVIRTGSIITIYGVNTSALVSQQISVVPTDLGKARDWLMIGRSLAGSHGFPSRG